MPINAGIYKQMEKDWDTYCLMSGIALIEEMKKPTLNIQKKESKTYNCFHTIRFKMKDKISIIAWQKITRKWEIKTGKQLLGKSFKSRPHQEKGSGQWYIIFSPEWLYEILKTTGPLPSKDTNNICFERIKNMRHSRGKRKISNKELKKLQNKPSLYTALLNNKFLATGGFIVSFDLEFRGATTGNLSLCMTTRYEDFLKFMLNVAKKWGWNTSEKLSKVNLDHSLKRGIKANPKKEFRLKIKSLEDIYTLAGPLTDKKKDKFIKFHIKRSNNPQKAIKGRTKTKIIKILKNKGPTKSTLLQIPTGVRVDVILHHLKELEKNGIVEKERKGKFYLWSYIGE